MTDRLDLIRARFAAAEPVEPLPEAPHPAPPDDDRGHDPGDPGPEPRDAAAEEEISKAAICAAFPLNDIGNGQRFAAYFGDDVIRVSRVGWYCWNEKIWAKDEEDQRGFSPAVRRMAHQVSTLMVDEIPHIPMDPFDRRILARADDLEQERARLEEAEDPDRAALADVRRQLNAATEAQKRLRKRRSDYHSFAKSTGNSSRLDAMLREGSVGLNHTIDEMDADPLELAAENGVLAFSVVRAEGMGTTAEVRLRPHRRDDLITKMMPVAFDAQARSPEFDRFLERVQPNPEMRAFIQRWFGLNLTSITGDQKLAFFYGSGANGKSVLTDLMARIMGDYAATAKIESLTGTSRRSGSDATPDLIPLMGARMVRASEPEQGTRLQEGVIKELTGGEPLLVRALHSDFVEVHPQFKLTISGNHKPDIRGTDDGIWRRVMLIPFDVQIPEAERDPDLGKKLWKERAGILNWMVAGLIDYLEGGLQVPQDVASATQGYREDSDPLGVFLADCCEVTGAEVDVVRAKELIDAFNWWLADRGEGAWKPQTVARQIKERAKSFRDPRTGRTFTSGKRSVSVYLGIKLADMFRHRMAEGLRQDGWSQQGSHAEDRSPDPF